MTQTHSNVMIGETLYFTGGDQKVRRAIVNEIRDPQKGIVDLTVFTNASQYGCSLASHVEFDPKAPSLNASDLDSGKGTENTWHRREATQQQRAAGAGR